MILFIPLDDIIGKSPLKNEPINEIKFWVIELERKKMLRRIIIPTSGEKIEIFLKGFLYYEEFYSFSNKEYTDLTISILEIFRKVEKNKIALSQGEGVQKGIISNTKLHDFLNKPMQAKYEKQINFRDKNCYTTHGHYLFLYRFLNKKIKKSDFKSSWE